MNAQLASEQAETKRALRRESAALGEVTKANDAMQKALRREQKTAYHRGIALARQEWFASHLGAANQILNDCKPEELRGWEWHYIVHYANGQMREIPIIVGGDVADWWNQPNEENKKLVVAWTGMNEASRRVGRTIRLFKTTWENPIPKVEVKRIDFVSTHDEAAPFLVAITAE